MFPFTRLFITFPHVVRTSSWIVISLLLVGCSGSTKTPPPPSVAATETPGGEVSAGERLFLETRFAQAFKVFLDNGGNINNPNAGDPVMNLSETTGARGGTLWAFRRALDELSSLPSRRRTYGHTARLHAHLYGSRTPKPNS